MDLDDHKPDLHKVATVSAGLIWIRHAKGALLPWSVT